MRRALREQLPALSYWFGLTPSDVDELWPSEADVYVQALVDIAERQNVGGGKRRG